MAKARNGLRLESRIRANASANTMPRTNDSAVYSAVFLTAEVITSGNMSAAISVLKKFFWIFGQSACVTTTNTTTAARPYIMSW